MHNGPRINKTNLRLSIDPGNISSCRGEPTTNLVSDPFLVSGVSATLNSGFEYTCTRTNVLPLKEMYGISNFWYKCVKNNANNGRVVAFTSLGVLTTSVDYVVSMYTYIDTSAMTSLTWGTDNVNNSTVVTTTGYDFTKLGKIQRPYTVFRSVNGSQTMNMRSNAAAAVGTTFYFTGVQAEQKSVPTAVVNGTRGTTVATGGGFIDLSRNVNAEIVGGANIVYDPYISKLGYASLDGVDDYILTGQVPGTGTSTASHTFSIWVYPTSTAGNIISMSSSNPQTSWNMPPLRALNQKFEGRAWSAGTLVSDTYTLNKWHHVVFVFEYNAVQANRGQYLYVNGKLAASETNMTYNSSGSDNYLFIGQQNPGADNRGMFAGRIGSCLVYASALSAADVAQLYNAHKSKYGL